MSSSERRRWAGPRLGLSLAFSLALSLGVAGCGAEAGTALEVSVPTEARSMLVSIEGRPELLAAAVSSDGSIDPLLLSEDDENPEVRIAFFEAPPSALDLALGPVRLPSLQDSLRDLPLPLASWVGPLRGALSARGAVASAPFDALGLNARTTCLERVSTSAASTPTGFFATAVAPLSDHRALVVAEDQAPLVVQRDGSYEVWTDGPRARDLFVDRDGRIWVVSDGLRILEPSLGPSDALPSAVTELSGTAHLIEGPRDQTATEVGVAMVDGRVLRLSSQGAVISLGTTSIHLDGGLEDMAWADEALHLGFAHSLTLRVFDARGERREVVTEPIFDDGTRALYASPRWGLFLVSKLGDLYLRPVGGSWTVIPRAVASMVGGRRAIAAEEGLAWIDDRAVIYGWGPETGVCGPTLPFGVGGLDGHRLFSDGFDLFVAALNEPQQRTEFTWLRPPR